jgi:hypothetical protein
MKRRLLSNVVVAESSTVLKLPSIKDQSLLVWRNALFVLNFRLHILNCIAALYINRHGLASLKPDKDLKSTYQPQRKMKRRLLSNVVVAESSTVLKLPSIKDQSLLVWRNALFVLNFRLHILNCIAALYINRHGLASLKPDKDLKSTYQPQRKMKRRLLSNVVVAESSTVLKLPSIKDQSLLVWRNALFVLNFRLHILNCIAALYINRHGLASLKPDKDLKSTYQPQRKMKRRLLSNVVVAESSTVLKLPSIKDQSLLVWRNALFVLNFRLHILNCIAALYINRHGLASLKPDKDLKSTYQPQRKMKRRLLSNVVVAESSTVLKLPSIKDQSLLVWRNALFVLNFRLHILNCIAALYINRHGLASLKPDKDLKSTYQPQRKMKRRLLSNVVVAESSTVLKLPSIKDQSLLVWRNALFVLNFRLHILNCIAALYINRHGLASLKPDKDLKSTYQPQRKMKRRLLSNVVVAESSTVLKLPSIKDQSLLVWRNSLSFLYLFFEFLYAVNLFHLYPDYFTCWHFDVHPHSLKLLYASLFAMSYVQRRRR